MVLQNWCYKTNTVFISLFCRFWIFPPKRNCGRICEQGDLKVEIGWQPFETYGQQHAGLEPQKSSRERTKAAQKREQQQIIWLVYWGIIIDLQQLNDPYL